MIYINRVVIVVLGEVFGLTLIFQAIYKKRVSSHSETVTHATLIKPELLTKPTFYQNPAAVGEGVL